MISPSIQEPFSRIPVIRTVFLLSCVGILFASSYGLSDAQEWTRFRGPNGSGISAATNFPLKWTADDYNWQIDLPIMGSSSPVLWGKRLYLMGDHADGQQRSILCINADSGRILWRRDYPVKRHRLHRDNDFTSATPCVDCLLYTSPSPRDRG